MRHTVHLEQPASRRSGRPMMQGWKRDLFEKIKSDMQSQTGLSVRARQVVTLGITRVITTPVVAAETVGVMPPSVPAWRLGVSTVDPGAVLKRCQCGPMRGPILRSSGPRWPRWWHCIKKPLQASPVAAKHAAELNEYERNYNIDVT